MSVHAYDGAYPSPEGGGCLAQAIAKRESGGVIANDKIAPHPALAGARATLPASGEE
jgi:hypothetical protein